MAYYHYSTDIKLKEGVVEFFKKSQRIKHKNRTSY